MSLLGELTHRDGGESQPGPLCNAHVHLQACDPQGNSKTLDVTVPVHDEKVFRAIREHAKYHDAASRILHESALQQVVNSFEFLMASIVRQHIRENLKAVSAEHSITYRELLEYGSLEEAQRRVTEAQVLEFLRNKDAAEQLKHLKDSLKVDIRNHFTDVDRFLELVLRRHAVVHADGIATAEYRRKAKKLMKSEELPAEGTRLALDSSYITGSWDCVYSMGIITCHLWARSRALDRKDKEAEEAADNHLNNAAFWALQNQRWAAAQAILGYASKLKLASEGGQRMVAVNLAQAFKWAGDQRACDEVLDKHDWGASSSVFQATVEALRNGPRLEELLGRAIRDGDINSEDVNTWPVFRQLREDSGFLGMMGRLFGTDGETRDSSPQARLLDFDYEKTMARLRSTGRGIAVRVRGDMKPLPKPN